VARGKPPVREGRREFLDEPPRNWVVLGPGAGDGHIKWIDMRAARHVPKWQHHAEVGIAELGVGRVVDPVELWSDREAVYEPGNLELDIRVPHETGDGLRDELPIDQLCRYAERKEREPNHPSTPERVEEVMASSLQGMQAHGGVMNRVQPPQGWRGVAEAVVAVFKGISQDDDEDDLQPERAFPGPDAEEIR